MIKLNGKRLGRVQSQAGCGGEENIPSHAGNQTPIVKPTAGHFID
jgi:hypothetical protein